jgi:hypothetical protein
MNRPHNSPARSALFEGVFCLANTNREVINLTALTQCSHQPKPDAYQGLDLLKVPANGAFLTRNRT